MSVNLSIKDVPDELAAKLRARAARNHRSLQGELIAILAQAAGDEGRPPAAGEPVTRFGAGWRRGTRTIEEIAAEHKRQFPKPMEGGPLAVDILRADRDAR